ncbi:hypothetical protein PLUTE_a6017 [Pseudoalteromonas luteoviolacea DSM 6061]|nr:hypothetical protein [Pseudoalteromonas luteoviolacea DSM 6061]
MGLKSLDKSIATPFLGTSWVFSKKGVRFGLINLS